MSHSPDDYLVLPKIELHRHLEGSLRLQTLLEIARSNDIDVPREAGQLRQLVQVQAGEPYTYQNFLSKFITLRAFYRSTGIIARITREAVEDAAHENVRYMELRFTPAALSRAQDYPLAEVTSWVCESAREAGKAFGVDVRLIASVNRHEDPGFAEQVVEIVSGRQDGCIVGLDLAGSEAEFDARPFRSIFETARQAGMHITVHAGEWAGAHSVHEALEDLQAERIGHGVRILEDDSLVELGRERGTTFEVCVTSNYQTGVVPSLEDHPLIEMLNRGLNVTLDTDDPSISGITLADEYRQACEVLGMSRQVLKERIIAAAKAAFLPEQDRSRLVERMKKELDLYQFSSQS